MKKEKETPQTRTVTTMKKATMKAIVNYLTNNLSYADADEKEFLQAAVDELTAELNRGAEKAQANRELYAEAHDTVIAMMGGLTSPATISELYDEVADRLPEGMTKGKFQYAVTRLWNDEIVKTEGKVNAYSLKA